MLKMHTTSPKFPAVYCKILRSVLAAAALSELTELFPINQLKLTGLKNV